MESKAVILRYPMQDRIIRLDKVEDDKTQAELEMALASFPETVPILE